MKMNQVLPAKDLPGNWRGYCPPPLLCLFLGLEVILLLVAGLAGIKYVFLIVSGTVALLLCFGGRLPALFALLAISPVVFLKDVPLDVIRVGKWIFVIMVVLSWLVGRAMRRERIFVPTTAVNYFILGFVLWGIFISLLARDFAVSFFGLFRIISIFGLFYLFTDVISSRDDIRKTVAMWIGTGIFLALFGIFQYQLSVMRQGAGQRIWSTFENPNNLGLFLFLLIPVVISFFYLYRKPLIKVGLGFALGLLLVCLLWTGSRASWLGLYVACLAFGVISKRKYLTSVILILGAILGLILSLSLVKGDLITLLRMERGLALRPILWQVSWRIFKDHPLFGVGIGCIPAVFQSYYPISSLSLYSLLSPAAGSPHSLFLQMGAEMGGLGVVLVLFFFGVYFRELKRTLGHLEDEFLRALIIAFWATLPGLFVHSFFELSGVIGPGSYTVFFWLSVSLAQAVRRVGGQNPLSRKIP